MSFKDLTIKLLKDVSPEAGRYGAYTKNQAEGAWSNGSRVEKRLSVEDDAHRDGACATIIGSVGPITREHLTACGILVVEGHETLYVYFVEWDDLPGVPVSIISHRLKLLAVS